MTDTYVRSDLDDPIDTGPELRSDALEREADAILERADPTAPRTMRQIMREEEERAAMGVEGRRARARAAIAAEPIRATLYALGAGVILGMLLRR